MPAREPSSRLFMMVALGAMVWACGSDQEPVARLEVAPDRIELSWPSFVEVEVRLQPLAELPVDVTTPRLFVHLLDETGNVLITFDHPVPGAWRPGREIRYRLRLRQSALAEPLAPGDYQISAGLYDLDAGRFALVAEAEPRGRFEYLVAVARVPAVGDNAPRARFSADWLPAEAGGDRQVTVRRTLRGDVAGRVQFGPMTGPGLVTFGLFVPAELGRGSRLELLDSSGQPKLRLVSTCGAEALELSGTGRFDVDFQLPAGFGPADCELSVEPNFRLTSGDRAETTSVRLESVAWRAGAVDANGTAPD